MEVRSPRSRRALGAMLAGAFVALAGFVALGVWQVQRLAWKEDLIARVEQHVHAAPAAVPAPGAWPALQRAADEYRRVRVRGQYAAGQDTLVRASTELGTGYWVLTPLRTEQGFWVLVNRGFVPSKDEPRAPRCTAPDGTACTREVTGLLRFSEPGGSLLQHNAAAQERWYSRDVAAIAAARGLGRPEGPPVAPYFIDAAADGTPAGAWPRAGLTVLHFSNNHAVYAVTWFALAAMVACAIGYLVIDERRLRRLHSLAGERQLVPPRVRRA